MSAKPFSPSIRLNAPVSFDRVRVAVACAPHGGWTIHMPKRAETASRPDR
jgi:hypothetical protein